MQSFRGIHVLDTGYQRIWYTDIAVFGSSLNMFTAACLTSPVRTNIMILCLKWNSNTNLQTPKGADPSGRAV